MRAKAISLCSASRGRYSESQRARACKLFHNNVRIERFTPFRIGTQYDRAPYEIQVLDRVLDAGSSYTTVPSLPGRLILPNISHIFYCIPCRYGYELLRAQPRLVAVDLHAIIIILDRARQCEKTIKRSNIDIVSRFPPSTQVSHPKANISNTGLLDQ